MPSIDIDIDIDVIYDSCSNSDKLNLVGWLSEDGYYGTIEPIDFPTPQNYLDNEWEEIIKKLAVSRIQLTMEHVELIKSIVNNVV